MKVLLLVFGLFCLSVSPAVAYLDDTVAGEAEATAGEQNSNLYRLNSLSTVSIKKLKKIDEVMAKNPNKISNLDMDQIEQLVDSKAGETQQILDKALKDAIKRTKSPITLKNSVSNSTYIAFKSLSAACVKDKQIALALRDKIQRGRR